MQQVLNKLEAKFRKKRVPMVKSGDTVRVHQKIKEGSKTRTQVFEGVVIRTDRMGSATARITVRRIASGVGVEKSFLLHSPNVLQVEITKRSKVRRNYLSYMRDRRGKSARLAGIDFDSEGVNLTIEEQQEMEMGVSAGSEGGQETESPEAEGDSGKQEGKRATDKDGKEGEPQEAKDSTGEEQQSLPEDKDDDADTAKGSGVSKEPQEAKKK